MLSVCSRYKLPICLGWPGSALYGCKDPAQKATQVSQLRPDGELMVIKINSYQQSCCYLSYSLLSRGGNKLNAEEFARYHVLSELIENCPRSAYYRVRIGLPKIP